MIMLFISILAMAGISSASIDATPGFDYRRRPFTWGVAQQIWTGVLGAAWIASMILSWKYANDVATRCGAAVLASLPLVMALFYFAAHL
jgi:hypothetical protein